MVVVAPSSSSSVVPMVVGRRRRPSSASSSAKNRSFAVYPKVVEFWSYRTCFALSSHFLSNINSLGCGCPHGLRRPIVVVDQRRPRPSSSSPIVLVVVVRQPLPCCSVLPGYFAKFAPLLLFFGVPEKFSPIFFQKCFVNLFKQQ